VIPSQKLILVGVANVLAIAPTSLLVKMSRGSKSLAFVDPDLFLQFS